MKKYALSVDVGGIACKMGLFETTGKIICKWKIKTDTSDKGSAILCNIARSIEEKMKEQGVDKHNVQGIGLGVPGSVMDDGTVNKCVNLGWGVFNIEKKMEKMTGLSVKAVNDANAAALGEMWQGAGRGFKNIIMVTLGTGIGGGIIIDGGILAGVHGAAGEFGHIKVNPQETQYCGCGKKGCLEQYASAAGIVKMARQELQNSNEPTVLRSLEEITAKDIFDGAKAGDKIAARLIQRAGELLGTVLAGISCVADPEIYVIGGGVSDAGLILLETIQKFFSQNAFHAGEQTKFALASLGNDAGLYGCAWLMCCPDSI